MNKKLFLSIIFLYFGTLCAMDGAYRPSLTANYQPHTDYDNCSTPSQGLFDESNDEQMLLNEFADHTINDNSDPFGDTKTASQTAADKNVIESLGQFIYFLSGTPQEPAPSVKLITNDTPKPVIYPLELAAPNLYICPFCQNTFRKFLQNHISQCKNLPAHHNWVIEIQGKYKNKKYSAHLRPSSLQSQRARFWCPHCRHSYLDIRELAKHFNSYHPGSTKPLPVSQYVDDSNVGDLQSITPGVIWLHPQINQEGLPHVIICSEPQ